jgi:hypothetical protein
MTEFLVGATQEPGRTSIEGTRAHFAVEHPSLTDSHSKFAQKKSLVPFETVLGAKVRMPSSI